MCILASLGVAQKTVITDAEFGSYLCANYPEAVSVGCDSLLLGPAQNIEGFMDLSNSTIVDAQILRNFHRIDSLDLSNNPQMVMMDSVQTADYWSLDHINMSNNQLDSVPFFSINPNFVIVSELILANNNLTSFQKYWSGRDSIRVLDLSNNYISDVENWTQAVLAESINISNNYLTFEDILPQTDHINFSTVFTVSPQRKIKWAQPSITAMENGDITLDLLVDDNVVGNTYTWYRNGGEIGSTTSNQFLISSLTLADSGMYSVKIVNNNILLAGLQLESEELMLKVSPCMDISGFSYDLTEQCYGAELNFDQLSIVGGVPPYKFVLTDSYNVESIVESGENKVLSGTYQFEVSDNFGCSKLIESDFMISPKDGCDKLVITPDGDNQQDEYYFTQTGLARVFNQNGVQVAEFNLPGFWDARSTSGEVVSPGKYVMVIDNHEKVELIIMW